MLDWEDLLKGDYEGMGIFFENWGKRCQHIWSRNKERKFEFGINI